MTIVLVTATVMPKPDVESHLVVEALTAVGVEASILPWDAELDWASVDLVVVRTPWDYVHRLEEFLGWAERVAAVTRIVNPISVLRWNTHKRYLLELNARGVPVVPTRLLSRGELSPGQRELSSVAAEVVVKPAVGAGARGALRAFSHDPALRAHMGELLATGDVLVQPFLRSVLEHGEVSLVFLGGALSHSIRKVPKPGDYRVQGHHGGSVLRHMATPEELRVAKAALAAAPAACAYARIDLIATERGPVVMEMELVEPELFLPACPGAAERFAAVLVAALRDPCCVRPKEWRSMPRAQAGAEKGREPPMA